MSKCERFSKEVPNENFLFVLHLVRPLHIELTGGDGPIREGAVVTLVCRVEGAKPPANITWFNGSDPLPLNAQPRSSVAVQVSYFSGSSLSSLL